MKAIVIDLDGTLSDCSGRLEFAQNGQWDDFHLRCALDEPFIDVAWLVRFIASYGLDEDQIELIGCTGRNERYRAQTEAWLNAHGLYLDLVLMRPDDDFTPDHELKLRMLEEWNEETSLFGGLNERILFALEDRDKVVEAFRSAGVRCWQVRHGSC